MKKTNFLKMALVGLIAVTTICSCNKENGEGNPNGNGNGNNVIQNNIIVATVDSGASYNAEIDSVKARIYFSNYDDINYAFIARAPYVNGGFTLTLPAIMGNQYLGPFSQDIPSGLTVSDANAMGISTSLYAYKTNENGYEMLVGLFSYLVNDWESVLMYADRDLDITGNYTDDEYTEKFDLHLKKGWNMCYIKETVNINEDIYESEITTQTPEGIGKWYFESFNITAKKSASQSGIAQPKKAFWLSTMLKSR